MNGTEADSTSIRVDAALRGVHLYLADINPDGWAAGDLGKGALYSRGNSRGSDLNREFPTLGWTKTSYTPLSESESISWDRFVQTLDPVTTADLHGELTSVNDAFADIMIPAGQWNPLFQAQEERLARHMTSNVYRYFNQTPPVVLGAALAPAGMRPAAFATGYDVVGYDDSGFMGDYFTQTGAIDMDVEHFLSHTAPNNAFIPVLEQAHVAAVRGEIETLIVEAIVAKDVHVSLDLGAVGYLYDPRVVTDADGYGDKAPPDEFVSYEATPMRYFEDLGKFTTEPLRKVPSADAASGGETGLGGLDSFVVTTWPLPPDPLGRSVQQGDVVQRIRSFVEGGGNLILTDEGLKALEALGLAASGSVTKTLTNAGHVDITSFTDRYTANLNSTASQTYYEVALGYTASGNAPHWSVPTAAWQAAGGISVGTVASGKTGLGRIALGQGTVGIIGALLPPATEKNDHYFGLADYGVSVTGGQILNNMLAAA